MDTRKNTQGSMDVETERLTLSPDLANRLRQSANEQGVHLKTTLLSAFCRTVGAEAGSARPVVGVVVNTRPPLVGAEAMLGLFLNTVPFGVDVVAGTMRDLVARVADQEQALMAHASVPLTALQGLARHAGPLFDALFNYTDFLAYRDALRTEAAEVLAYEERANIEIPLQVQFSVRAEGSGLDVVLQWDASRIDTLQISRFRSRLLLALNDMADPDAVLMHRSLLLPEERTQLLALINDEHPVEETGSALVSLIERAFADHPSSIALSGEQGDLTFRQLEELSRLLAMALIQRGVRPGDRVAVLMDRSVAMVTALVAILRAGAAYVPLDPAYPEDRLRFMLADANARLLITTSGQQGRLEAREGQISLVLDDLSQIRDFGAVAAVPAVTGQAAAYLIYTSGSTGRPKGVLVSHAAIENRLTWMARQYEIGPADTLLQKTPYSFDVSVWELFLPLICGSRLVIAKPDGHKDPDYLSELIDAERVTVVHFVPTMLTAFLRLRRPKAVSPLRHVFCSGEALPPDVVETFFEYFDCRLHNLYGPTEAAVDVTYWECVPGRHERSIPIGRPIDRTGLHVLDDAGRAVPPGTSGELHLSGRGLADGYWGRPDLTRSSFISLASIDGRQRRMYRTGDRAYVDPRSGLVHYLGRGDAQIKLRGQRIELGEIEAAIRQVPGVTGSAVTLVDSPSGSRMLAAFYCAPEAIGADLFIEHLSRMLPEAMLPQHWQRIAEIPVSPSGKLDRKALVASFGTASSDDIRPRAPLTSALEQQLARIWTEVLGRPVESAEDNFFSRGGDSILSLSVISKARAAGLSIQLEDLYKHPTLGALASRVERRGLAATVDIVPPAPSLDLPPGVEAIYPLSRLQLGLIYAAEMHRGTAMYHDIMSYRLRAPFNEQGLRRALQETIRRHPVLRTTFALEGFSQPMQRVLQDTPAKLSVIDLRTLDARGQAQALKSFHDTERQRVFDWQEPPFYVSAHLHDDDHFSVSLSFHDSLMDGWSVSVLIKELLQGYMEDGSSADRDTAPRANMMREFVALEERALADPASRSFWTERVSQANPSFMLDFWRAETGLPPVIRQHEVDIPVESERKLKALAVRLGVSLKTVLLTVHMRVLSVLLGNSSVTTGLEHSGRPELSGAEDALGLFLNTVPLSVVFGGQSWETLIKEIHAAEADLLPHRHYPLVSMLSGHKGTQLFDVVFNYVHFHVLRNDQSGGWDDVLAGFEAVLETEYPLRAEFGLHPVTGGLRFSLHYAMAALASEAVERIAGYYQRAMAALCEAPEGLATATCLLSAREMSEDVEGIGYRCRPFDQTLTAAQMFFKASAASPDALAVVCGDRELTYAALAHRVRSAAHALSASGVAAGDIVCVMDDRSELYLATMLAILSIGAVYVPLDPRNPADRLALMAANLDGYAVVRGEQYAGLLQAMVATRKCRPPLQELFSDNLFAGPPAAAMAWAPATGADPAYILFTSGSTGTPKGATVAHGGMVNHLLAKIEDLQLGPGVRLLQNAPQSFDVSVWQFLAAVAIGGTCVIGQDQDVNDPAALIEFSARHQLAVIEVVPSILAAMLELREDLRRHMSALRHVVSTGEALKEAVAAQWLASMQGVPLVNAYGPAECSDDVTHHFILTPADLAHGAVPIGRAIRNARLFVLDPSLHPCPREVPGQLVVGGICVGLGYVRDEARTRQAFIRASLPGGPDELLYRTGDVVRRHGVDQLIFVDRVDFQVKIGGVRLELGEIENALMQHPAILHAAAGVRDMGERRVLVAYVVVREGLAIDNEALKQYLGTALPARMVPQQYLSLPHLPYSMNGKVDRRALGAMPLTDGVSTSSAAIKAPRSDLEKQIQQAWAEVLGSDGLGIDLNFFDAGGDSLALIRLQAVLKRMLNVEIRLHELLMATTIEQQAHHVLNQENSLNRAVDAAKKRAERRQQAGRRVTPAQESDKA